MAGNWLRELEIEAGQTCRAEGEEGLREKKGRFMGQLDVDPGHQGEEVSCVRGCESRVRRRRPPASGHGRDGWEYRTVEFDAIWRHEGRGKCFRARVGMRRLGPPSRIQRSLRARISLAHDRCPGGATRKFATMRAYTKRVPKIDLNVRLMARICPAG